MGFKIKDLMIQVLDPKCPNPSVCNASCEAPTFCQTMSPCFLGTIQFCGRGPTICLFPSQCDFLSACGVVTACDRVIGSLCAVCSVTWDPTIVEQGDPAVGLAALKDQLKQAISQVETHQAALSESLLPQTVAEAEDLEKRLQGALVELKAHKAELQKRAKK